MAIISHISDASIAARASAQRRNRYRLAGLLPATLSLVVSAAAWGDIYKWSDEKGGIHYSDSPPPTSGKASNVEVVEKEIKSTPSEQALLSRIQNLERQLQAAQYPAQAPTVPPPLPYEGYPPYMPAPPPNYYGSGYDSSYDPGYTSSYSPGYAYPVVPAYSYAVFPRRTFFVRPAFVAPRSGFARAGGAHRGRR